MHSRDGNTVNPEATPAAESTSNSEQPIGLFALLNGMMTPMQDIAREAESEEFKNKIEKDPIGEGFGLLIRLLGGMAAGMEQAAKQAEEKAEENVADKKAASPVSSPKLANSSMFSSPVSSPELSPELSRSEASSPRLK